MNDTIAITRVEFHNFKAFAHYALTLSNMNLLVGPNNSGKSTILSVFRVLAAGLRRARARESGPVQGPDGSVFGYLVPTEDLPISLENAHTDYNTDVPTTVTFHLSNSNTLTLYFPPKGSAILIGSQQSRAARTPSSFSKDYPIRIEGVPVLGPLEHEEELVEKRTVQRGLVTHRASRHFRNYWHYFSEDFDSFAASIRSTWPEMDIEPPEFVGYTKVLSMFCREGRIERELYWAGFGFQVWCQLLTHIIRSKTANLLVVDEPEIYLHPDLQRRLLSLLRDAGPDILLATHSTELVGEAEPSEILIIDKSKKSAHRLKDTSQIQGAFDILGSNQNATLTQLARTQRVLVVEGTDFKILGRFAQLMDMPELASKFDFTVVPIGGVPQRSNLAALAAGIELALGRPVVLGAIFDRDYRCQEEVRDTEEDLKERFAYVHFHRRKEIENYLLVPSALDRAIRYKMRDNAARKNTSPVELEPAQEILSRITIPMRERVLAQYINWRVEYFKRAHRHSSTVTEEAIKIFDAKWDDVETRMEIVPGKEVFSALNKHLGDTYHFSLTPTLVISHFKTSEAPHDLVTLLKQLEKFRKLQAKPA